MTASTVTESTAVTLCYNTYSLAIGHYMPIGQISDAAKSVQHVPLNLLILLLMLLARGSRHAAAADDGSSKRQAGMLLDRGGMHAAAVRMAVGGTSWRHWHWCRWGAWWWTRNW